MDRIASGNLYVFLGCLAFLFGLVLCTSCKTAKKASHLHTQEKISDVFDQYEEKYDFISENFLTFQTFSAKFSVATGNFTCNGQMRIQKDSVIWISLVKFIEVARIKLTADSVWFYNKIQNQYVTEDYSVLKNVLPLEVNFKMLQSLFLGNDMLDYKKDPYSVFINPIDSSQVGYKFINRHFSENNRINQLLFADAQSGKINANTLQYSGLLSVNAMYADFVKTQGGLFPLKQLYTFTQTSNQIKLEMVFESPVLNSPLSFPLSIPTHAKPMIWTVPDNQ